MGRFAIEFFRADDRGGAAGLSTSQIIGLLIVGLCLALHRAITSGALEKWRGEPAA